VVIYYDGSLPLLGNRSRPPRHASPRLGAQQFVVMKQLQALGQPSQAELAVALAIDRSNLAAVAADLAARELVERTRHEVDRRHYVLHLSRAGEQPSSSAHA
jgi:DNA-binding MarR family transcriptional regulator